ncbi:trypsin-like peptidase domain-containing protein [Clostridium sp. YIM B02515]|uniref:Trypsin-like peptidase domain-containing protein n=1 Tax=Clostridium rhizosphaerae TaxID=2803861 RepID=A0ABS1TB95_9CLOT|nr:trypsin-like peptidase domain-containing protein [Clostridium rhizosphaerae]MBL4936628.1 trypsin-like peptidase domain-containing protein [Clostridium rhizosphaerae]
MENNNNQEFNQELNQENTHDTYVMNYTEPNNQKPKKKGSKFKKTLSYVAVGLVCTVIGGVASGAAVLYGLPKTDLFKDTALYKSLAGSVNTSTSVYDGHPTQLAATSGAMTVAEIAKKVGPAVVAVTTTLQTQQGFFGSQQAQGVGTGMIINEEGYILTNYHVVEGAQQVKVTLSNNKQVNAKVVNYDANYDVAVVKITDSVKVPAVVEIGDSDNLQVGESVVAIGNPLGTDFFGSVTTGIVSALNRKIDGDGSTNNQGQSSTGLSYIQTDAAINSGNSGGPLINSRGQVIGINTAKIKQSGVEGLGFSIPINAVKNKISDLSKPVLMVGIQGREIDKTLSEQYNLPIGLYIQDVTEFSPAEKAGLKRGDVITKFDGQKVTTFNEVTTIKNKHKSGDQISVTVNRDGKETNLTLTLIAQ